MGVTIKKYTGPETKRATGAPQLGGHRPTSREAYDPLNMRKKKKKRKALLSSVYPERMRPEPETKSMEHDPNWRKKAYSKQYPGRAASVKKKY